MQSPLRFSRPVIPVAIRIRQGNPVTIQPNVVHCPAIDPDRAHAWSALRDDLRALTNSLLDSDAYSVNVPSQSVGALDRVIGKAVNQLDPGRIFHPTQERDAATLSA